MKKIITLSLVIISVFSSCTKCRNCTCSLNGVSTKESQCFSGIDNTKKEELDKWQSKLIKDKGYDYCACIDSNH